MKFYAWSFEWFIWPEAKDFRAMNTSIFRCSQNETYGEQKTRRLISEWYYKSITVFFFFALQSFFYFSICHVDFSISSFVTASPPPLIVTYSILQSNQNRLIARSSSNIHCESLTQTRVYLRCKEIQIERKKKTKSQQQHENCVISRFIHTVDIHTSAGDWG